ncbi:Hypothetical predicted protein [Mytilus galloprovincialis]|uniref:C2H2-type domain-containing protein n=1 Tax=Mytilus galloprovincialis TaxID=29158 RepID=A0A8B6HAX3_MYTGA|nr:Hypothetical predicted protein [Mytilus galloprovincialis]
MDSDQSKESEYCVVQDATGKNRFQCKRCYRQLSSKHSVLYHLHSAHNMSPVKRAKKKYLEDTSIEIPRTTLISRRQKQGPLELAETSTSERSSIENAVESATEHREMAEIDINIDPTSVTDFSSFDFNEQHSEQICIDSSRDFSDTEMESQSGIWEDVLKNKNYIRNRYLQDNETITDITDGSLYRKLLSENDFLNGTDNTNLTAVINTDGVSLYSSSKVQLWPIFMAVNELNPCARFARENVILAGIWQGKGKPPFNTFIGSFCKLMNDLYDTGITEKLNGEETTVKLKVICGIYDLPAKAAILNMTQYNGSDSCITCEEPGKTVKQGKGTSRCFPYRETAEKYPNRNQAGVKLAMERGTERNRIKGFKGTSPLLDLKNFDIVSGTPPDYMHGVLLGVTKTLLYKWFSSTESKKEYFIGDKVKLISKRLNSIKPPESMERLPRDLEKNYTHFKATELQAWLIYYGIPCVEGILPNKYLEHFACLAEGVYFLLGDKISKNDLQRAHILLDAFFRNFSNLYPAGSCGLNVHNIGMHMVEYVRVLGPLWSWSCFPFEDCNSMITKTVHGTGDVTKQVMKIKEAQALLRNNLPLIFKGKNWKNLKPVANCEIAGAITEVPKDENTNFILEELGLSDTSCIKKVDRVMLNGKKMYSGSYTRMKRRICNTFLTKRGIACSVKYFIFHEQTQLIFALVIPLYLTEYRIGELRAGKYLFTSTACDKCKLLLVNELEENLWYIDPKVNGKIFIAKMPNSYGHSVFK